MLCRTPYPSSSYNDIRLRFNCNIIIIMEGDYAVTDPDRAKWDSGTIGNKNFDSIYNPRPTYGWDYESIYDLKPNYMLDGYSITANSVRDDKKK